MPPVRIPQRPAGDHCLDPREHLEEVLRYIRSVVDCYSLHSRKITVIPAEKGVRTQLKAAEKAKGSVIATCNDRIVWSPTSLTHMLACF